MDAKDRIILHCDLNCFFASVELLSHEDLRDVPMELLLSGWKPPSPIRMLTVTAINLASPDEAYEQTDLFDSAAPQKKERQEKLEQTMFTRKAGKVPIEASFRRLIWMPFRWAAGQKPSTIPQGTPWSCWTAAKSSGLLPTAHPDSWTDRATGKSSPSTFCRNISSLDMERNCSKPP